MLKYALIAIFILLVCVRSLIAYNKQIKVTLKPSGINSSIENYEANLEGTKAIISKDLKTLTYNRETYNFSDEYNYLSENKKIKLKYPIYNYIIKNNIDSILEPSRHNIPKIIWQMCKNKIEPDNPLFKFTESWKNEEKYGYEYKFVDDESGEFFIKDNFPPEVLYAFLILKPGAYKSDLLRLCLLYIRGGVYADIKLTLLQPLETFLEGDLVLVKDRQEIGIIDMLFRSENYITKKSNRIYNGFMASVRGHPLIYQMIYKIVENVKNKYYGVSSLEPTGPRMCGEEFCKFYKIKNIEIGNYEKYKMLIYSMYNFSPSFDSVINETNNYDKIIGWNIQKRKYKKNYGKDHLDYSKAWKKKDIYDLDLHKVFF